MNNMEIKELWSQNTTYGESVKDLYDRVYTYGYIPLEDLNKSDQKLIKKYHRLSMNNYFN